MGDETSIGGEDVRFRSTCWTLVLEAKDGAQDALDQLMGAYWKPVYFFIRRRGSGVEDAKDLTQSFFAALLEREFLNRVSEKRGRFRSFVLASLTNFLSDQNDRARAQKRGGHLKFVEAEADLASAEPTPEKAFQKEWARGVVARAMERLRTLVPPEDLGLLSGATSSTFTVDERKYRSRRLREKLKECLRLEVLPSVENEAQVESEIRDLLSASGS